MNEFKDTFDEMIDDDIENDTPNYFDDESDEGDDDEPAELRTAVMTKGEMIALITLRTTASGGQITRYDPREPLPVARRYDDVDEAARWFRRSLSTSLKNGWSVIYDGQPVFG
jgi:hypothetical protein